MYQKQCRLTLVDKFYGGGGPEIPQRVPGEEQGTINQWIKGQEKAYGRFAQQEPLLSGAYGAAGSLFGPMASQILPIIQSGGRLTPEMERYADQAALGQAAASGMANTRTGIAGQLLNREAMRQQRLSGAIGQYGQLIGQTLAPFATGISGYSALTKPVWGYLSDLFSSNQNAAAAQSIAGANKSAGTTGGITSALGSIIGGAAMAFSDERIKTDIKSTGEKTPEGVPIKTFRYKTDPQKRRYTAVLAQDVERKVPAAVLTDPISGLKAVDYSKINAPFLLTQPLRKVA